MYSGRLDADSGGLKAAEAARAAPAAPAPPRSIDLVLDGLARRCTEGPDAGVPPLRLALEAVSNEALDDHGEIMRWLMLSPIVQSMTVFELWDDDAFHALATRAVRAGPGHRRTRPASRRTRLPVRRARVRRGARRGRGARPRRRTRSRWPPATRRSRSPGSLLDAWRGVEAEAMAAINAGLEERHRGNGCRRWPATPPPSSTTAWAATRRPWTAPGAAATTATGATPARACRSSSRRRPVAAGRRSLPPRCPGWKSGRRPRARIGRSASSRAHGRC